MAGFDESELEVAQILLQLPRLIFDCEIRSVFALAWGSRKKRTMRRFAPLSSWKTPVSLRNSKLIITLKRKRSENLHPNSPRSGGTKERSSCFSAMKDESSNRKKVKRCSNSSGRAFLIPDLNLPPFIESEEENCHEHEAHKSTLLLTS